MSGLQARNGGPAGIVALAAILALGLGLRLDNAWDGRAPVFDAQGYAEIAANLAGGEGFALDAGATQPASNYSPGLPLLVGGIYALAGEDERLARIVLALLGWLAVPLAYLLGRRLANPVAGLLAAAFVAIYPALLEYQGMLMGEPLAATLLAAAVLSLFWAEGEIPGALSRNLGARASRLAPDSERGFAAQGTDCISPLRDIPERAPGISPGESSVGRSTLFPLLRWLAPGLLFGALVLVRPEYLGITLLVAVVVVVRKGMVAWRMHLAQAAVMLVGALLVVAPWTVRNAVVLERFVPVSTGGGQVLFAGSYMPSGGDPEQVGEEVLKRHPGLARQLPAEARLEQILAVFAKQRYPTMESDQALARIGRARLWRAVSEEPLSYAGYLAAKVWNMWGHGPRRVMEQPGWAILHWTLLALAALGLGVLGWRRRWEALPIAVILAATAVIGLLLVASPRRMLVLLPLLAALAGVGATWLDTRIRPFTPYDG